MFGNLYPLFHHFLDPYIYHFLISFKKWFCLKIFFFLFHTLYSGFFKILYYFPVMDLSCFSVACCLFIEVSMSSIFNTIIGNKNTVINIFSNTAFTCMLLLLLLLSRFSRVQLPPGSPVPGILQARTLEWVAISLFAAWKWKVKVKLFSHVWLLVIQWTAAYQAP